MNYHSHSGGNSNFSSANIVGASEVPLGLGHAGGESLLEPVSSRANVYDSNGDPRPDEFIDRGHRSRSVNNNGKLSPTTNINIGGGNYVSSTLQMDNP